MSYTANQFLAVLKRAGNSLITEDVNCPELSEDGKSDFPVHLKELNGTLMDLWNKCFEEIIDDASLQSKYNSPSTLVIALSLVDQAGDRVFKPHDFKTPDILFNNPTGVAFLAPPGPPSYAGEKEACKDFFKLKVKLGLDVVLLSDPIGNACGYAQPYFFRELARLFDIAIG